MARGPREGETLTLTAAVFDLGSGGWLRFSEPEDVFQARSVDQVRQVVQAAQDRSLRGGKWVVGCVSYEAAPAFDRSYVVRAHDPDGRPPLCWFGIFGAAEPMGSLPAFGPHAVPRGPWKAGVDRAEYLDAIARVKDAIARGHTYQVNYTYRLAAPFDFEQDPLHVFAGLIGAQGSCLGAYLDTGRWVVCSASPELFFTLHQGRLVSRPMKGTAPRAPVFLEDRDNAERLRASPKETAENVMIVDMVRNDMGRIARSGTVTTSRLFDVEQYPTVWQMTSTVECATDAGFTEVMEALFPAASITGAPKVRTMELIAELESSPRGVYTGAIGFLAPGGAAQWNVAIRTLVLDRELRTAEYGIGGGITWDSDPLAEYEESIAKARILTRTRPSFDLLETLLWTPEAGYVLLEEHLARLLRAASYFGYAADAGEVRNSLAAEERRFDGSAAMRVRVLVGNRGNVAIESRMLEQSGWYRTIRLAASPVDATDPFLYYKTTHRDVYEAAQASVAGATDVLLWNERRELTESTIANVAVDRNGILVTPPVACGLLDGTFRERLLREGSLTEQPISIDDLQDGAEILLFNSVRGFWRVRLER